MSDIEIDNNYREQILDLIRSASESELQQVLEIIEKIKNQKVDDEQ